MRDPTQRTIPKCILTNPFGFVPYQIALFILLLDRVDLLDALDLILPEHWSLHRKIQAFGQYLNFSRLFKAEHYHIVKVLNGEFLTEQEVATHRKYLNERRRMAFEEWYFNGIRNLNNEQQ